LRNTKFILLLSSSGWAEPDPCASLNYFGCIHNLIDLNGNSDFSVNYRTPFLAHWPHKMCWLRIIDDI